MTEDYVAGKVAEAIQATGGDKKDAQKLLITWAVRDQQLLLGLSKPHLKALVAAQIDHATRGHRKSDEESASGGDTLTMAHLKADKRRAIKVPPPKSSERQASVMHQLVAAFKRKGS